MLMNPYRKTIRGTIYIINNGNLSKNRNSLSFFFIAFITPSSVLTNSNIDPSSNDNNIVLIIAFAPVGIISLIFS